MKLEWRWSKLDINRIILRRRQWHPTPVLLPGESHGWRSPVGCSSWDREELDTTEQLHFLFSLSCIGEGNGNPLQCSCLENPREGGTWWAAVSGVARSRTRLKRLSSSSSIHVKDIINPFSTSVFKKLSILFSVASLTFYFPTTLHHHLVWINCVFEYYRYLYFNFEDYCKIKPIIVQSLLNKTMPYSENGGEIKP